MGTRRQRRGAAVGLAVAVGLVLGLLAPAGCGGDAASDDATGRATGAAAPALPPLQLRPMQQELEQRAATLPQPDERTRQQLQELCDIALGVVTTDARLQARSERALLEHELGWWPLERALSHDAPAVRSRAAWLCGRSGHGQLQLPLLLRLKYELDPEAILWVAEALFRLGNDTGLGWLDGGMTRQETAEQAGRLAIEVCRSAGRELGEEPTYAELQRQLRALLARWRQRGTGACPDAPATDPDALAARCAAHLAVMTGTQLRPIDDARFVLARTGTLALEPLRRALAADEHRIRTRVLQILIELGASARPIGPAVLPLLGDPITAVYAIRALGEIGYDPAVPHLRPLLAAPDTERRAAACGALGLLGDAVARPLLQARLDDPDEAMDVRVQAAFALAWLGDTGAAAARAFLEARLEAGDYHEAMLRLLLERLDGRGS